MPFVICIPVHDDNKFQHSCKDTKMASLLLILQGY